MNSFLTNFYGTLFSPIETFSRLKENPPLLQGFFIVLFVSILSPLLEFKFSGGIRGLILFDISLIFRIIFGLISWLFLASFFESLARIFKRQGGMKVFLTLSAFALLPWIFLGPAELFKTAGILGQILGILIGLGIWLWVTILIVMVIIKTYDFSLEKALALLMIPFFGGTIAFYWIMGFLGTLVQILKF